VLKPLERGEILDDPVPARVSATWQLSGGLREIQLVGVGIPECVRTEGS